MASALAAWPCPLAMSVPRRHPVLFQFAAAEPSRRSASTMGFRAPLRLVRATSESATAEVMALMHVFLPVLEAPTPPPSISFLNPTPSIHLWAGPCRSALVDSPDQSISDFS